MSLKSLEKRLRKLQKLKKLKELEPKVGPGKGDFTLLELCRASWNEDKERFKGRGPGDQPERHCPLPGNRGCYAGTRAEDAGRAVE